MACTGGIIKLLLRIDDEQSIGRGKKRDGLGYIGVPHELSSFLDCHVAGDGVGGTVQTAGSNNVDL